MAAAISFDDAYRALKRGQPASAYYLTGDEDMLKEELVELVIGKAVDEASRDFNLDVRSASDVNGEDFHSLVETPPMLAERRAVIIKNVEQWRKNSKVWEVVHRYLNNPSPTTVLVLVQAAPQKEREKEQKPDKEVARASVHVVVKPLHPQRLQGWIRARAEHRDVELTDEAAEHLASAVGSDLSQLAMEIDKLSAIALPDEPVNANQVAKLVGVRRGETVRDWVEAVLLRDIPRAIDMLEPVLTTPRVTGVGMVTALGSGLVAMRLARALIDSGMPPGRVESTLANHAKRQFHLKNEAALWTRAVNRWTAAEINDAIRSAYQCDLALKSTTLSDAKGIITGTLLSLPIKVAA
jgi:DNA polymerase-3 subunit delta